MGNSVSAQELASSPPRCLSCVGIVAVLAIVALAISPFIILAWASSHVCRDQVRRGKQANNSGCEYCGKEFLFYDQKRTPYCEYYKRRSTPISDFEYRSDLKLIRLRERLQCT